MQTKKHVLVTEIAEEQEEHLGKRTRVEREMQIEKTRAFLSTRCQVFKTPQQTCAIFVAIVHGNALGGPIR